MNFVKVHAEESKFERVRQRLMKSSSNVERVHQLTQPVDGFNFIVVLNYKTEIRFAKWITRMQNVIGIERIEEISMKEYHSFFPRSHQYATEETLLTMRIYIETEVSLVERIAAQIKATVPILSLYGLSGFFDLEVTIMGSTPHELADIIDSKIRTIKGVKKIETSLILRKY